MNWWLPHNFEQKKTNLQIRMQIIKSVRSFFEEQGFWEVDTPSLQTMPCADMHIHGFQTEYFGPDLKKQRDYYLHTSPEFEMKKLLVAGCPKIYQICKVFRNAENTKLHSPEFTMLEWYRGGADYKDIMRDCINLVRQASENINLKRFMFDEFSSDPFLEWDIISVADSFEKYAKIPLVIESLKGFAEAAESIGVRVAETDKWDDVFHAVMAEKIEPNLGIGAPTILCDYPASMACLSKKKADDSRYAERFELYICGVEIANAFTELTDAKEQRGRFVQEMNDKKELYGISYPLDEDFLEALEHGMPEAGGIALGLDRLIMLACGASNIEDVLWTAKP